MASDNQKFLEQASEIIRGNPDHPLRFLLNQQRTRVMTLEGGNGNYYDREAGAIYEGRQSGGKPTTGTRSTDIAEQLGVSVSCDACHLSAKKHTGGEKERFALGIAELNRADGRQERSTIIHHEAVSIGGVPVVKDHAREWEKAGLLPPGTVDRAAESAGWSRPDPKPTTSLAEVREACQKDRAQGQLESQQQIAKRNDEQQKH